MPAPATPGAPPPPAGPAAGRSIAPPLPPPAGDLRAFAPDAGGDAAAETLIMGAAGLSPSAPSRSAEETFSFDVSPAPAAEAAPSPSLDLVPAGFWIRVVAVLLDGIIQNVLTIVIAIPIVLATGVLGALLNAAAVATSPAEALEGLMAGLSLIFLLMVIVLMVIVPLLYEVVFVGWRGQTPGKILVKIKIIRNDGGEVDYVKSFIRWVGKWISGFTLGIGFLIAAFTANKRALHDYLAGTRVIRL